LEVGLFTRGPYSKATLKRRTYFLKGGERKAKGGLNFFPLGLKKINIGL